MVVTVIMMWWGKKGTSYVSVERNEGESIIVGGNVVKTAL